jgi:hypothetical protein
MLGPEPAGSLPIDLFDWVRVDAPAVRRPQRTKRESYVPARRAHTHPMQRRWHFWHRLSRPARQARSAPLVSPPLACACLASMIRVLPITLAVKINGAGSSELIIQQIRTLFQSWLAHDDCWGRVGLAAAGTDALHAGAAALRRRAGSETLGRAASGVEEISDSGLLVRAASSMQVGRRPRRPARKSARSPEGASRSAAACSGP